MTRRRHCHKDKRWWWMTLVAVSTLILLLLLIHETKASRRVQRVVEEDEDDDEDDSLPSPPASDEGARSGPSSTSVFAKGLTTKPEKLSAKSILDHHASYDGRNMKSRRMGGITLGYVTPWNSKGYSNAEIFGSKLTHVAPVWYQIREEEGGGGAKKLVLTGGHDVDGGWIEKVRTNSTVTTTTTATSEATATCSTEGQCVTDDDDDDDDNDDEEETIVLRNKEAAKFVPRVIWEVRYLPQPQSFPYLVQLLSSEMKTRGFDGWTFEMPLIRGLTVELFKQLKANNPHMILVAAQPSYQLPDSLIGKETIMTPKDMEELEPYIDFFSIMTYDFKGGQGGMPISPYRWIEDILIRLAPKKQASKVWSKLLIGIPFYGYGEGDAILSHDVINTLKSYPVTMAWDKLSREHIFQYNDPKGFHVMTYPTPHFLYERLQLSKTLGVGGIAIWELGQGMDYFMDLL